ncbi:nucleotidyltransferase family protein [Aliarcobacter butzleri]|uniref:nucleotidyltransferase family protein n=1 Tax=Aliarcobacter butzleri TaxID=28197 RepID=UPI0012604B37|nr:nucleotidyltransferase domain-containing protein [Aliarcobacter butzleri]MCT7625037.1 nucleotidyltransferase domain-containing protein [Aliarcobacter butzleri]
MNEKINKKTIVKFLIKILPMIKEKYNVEEIGLFGSYARNEATQESDIDIFIKMPPKIFDEIAIKNLIENEFGKRVDMIREHKHIKLFLLKSIKKDLILATFLTKDEIISKLKELKPLYKEKGFEIVCINDNEEEYTNLTIYYKLDIKTLEKYSEKEWAVTKLMEFFDEIKSHFKIEIDFYAEKTLKSNNKVIYIESLENLERDEEEFNKKKDESLIYRLSKENKDKLKELEIFKDKVSFQFKNGWFDLVYELGKNIEEVCKLASCELPRIEEIKSKYSSLRFDYYFKSDVKVPKIVEKLIDSLIYEAEDKSEYICEFCGSDGSSDITEDGTSIIKSCDRCKKEENEDLNENKELVIHDPKDYTFNCFWQTPFPAKQTVTSIIRNYLGTMNKQDIHTLCKKFGKDRVLKELNDKYKELFEKGFVNIKGLEIPLTGNYKDYELFKEILEIVNSYEK